MVYDFCENHIRSCNFNVQKKEKKKEEKKQILSDVGARIAKILIVRNLILSCKTFFERRDREIEFGRAVIIKEVL